MDLAVAPVQKLDGKITPSPSKFYTQFATAAALLADEKSVVKSPLLVDDARGLVKAIEDLGATTKRTKKNWKIWGTGCPPKPASQKIDAKKSIMCLSLLTSLSSLTSRLMVINGKKQVRSQSVKTLLDALQKLGVDVHSTKSDESPPLVTFESEIKGGKISLSENTNPRFLPAFLLLTPYAKEKVELRLVPEFKTPVTEMAVEIMKKSNIDISTTQRRLRVEPGEYKSFEVTPPLNMFSTFPYVAGAILTGSKLRIAKISKAKNVDAFTSLLEKMGVKLERTSRSVKISSSQEIRGRRYSLKGFSETIPFAAVIACIANGKTRIINAERARNMKSDRISAMAEGLERMGAKIEEKKDGLVIDGPAELEGAKVNGYEDDAVVAALGVAGLLAEGETIVKNRAETLRETYPRFVSTFQNLGAEMSYRS